MFLIPYSIMLFLAALPLFYMELVLGQFGQVGPNKIFGRLRLYRNCFCFILRTSDVDPDPDPVGSDSFRSVDPDLDPYFESESGSGSRGVKSLIKFFFSKEIIFFRSEHKKEGSEWLEITGLRIRIRSYPECFPLIRIRYYHSGSGSDQYKNLFIKTKKAFLTTFITENLLFIFFQAQFCRLCWC